MPKTINIPYNFTPRQYQLDFLSAPQRFKIAVWHRRAGKSKAVLNGQIARAITTPGIYYYFLPTYRQAKSVIWDALIKEHLPLDSRIVTKLNASELAVYFSNGSILRFAGTEDPDLHRGINPIDVIFDEYSEMNPEIWEAVIKPVLSENHGTATFIFTPKGKNHSWKLVAAANENPASWYVSIKTVDDTKGIDDDEIEEMRKTMPQALFLQEIYCDFQDNAGAVFRRVRANVYNGYERDAIPGHVYRIGIDLAKYNDFTVLTPFDESTFKVLMPDRFNQVDWNVQEARIRAMAYKFGLAQLMIDRTGVGDSVVDRLENDGMNIGEEGRVVFSQKTKNDLIMNLATLLENDKIKLPDFEPMLVELEAMQYELPKDGKGKMKIVTPKGMHDDCVMSLALAVYGVREPLGVIDVATASQHSSASSLGEGVYEAI